jgi:hypothetical protein
MIADNKRSANGRAFGPEKKRNRDNCILAKSGINFTAE